MAKEYIEREALLKRLCDNDPANMEDYYYNAIKEAPAADVVEVVTCKDCLHVVRLSQKHPDDLRCSCLKIDCINPNDFCSCGERKEQE